ncbi:MAG TPA: GMC family oxidoreductase [Gemmatimonadaceae bacterium]|nr:GMC family oxidoreductase [Gemmatimonadaceae bacterium]
MAAVCDTLFPRLPDSPGALSLSVPERIEETLAVIGRSERDGLRLLLRLLDRRIVMLLLSGRPVSFNALSQAQRERILRRMSVSLAPKLRSGFQGLFRLSAFHCYSAIEDGNGNPLWPSIGYTPSRNPPAARSPLAPRRMEAPARLECDVCIIGAGAGGSVAAAVLASRGHKVLVLEAGSDWQSEQFDQREAIGTRELYLDRATTTTSDLSIALFAGSGIGGGTTVNWQSCFRTPDAILEEWSDSSGCSHFSGESFGKSLDNVWGRLAVSRAESRLNPNNAILDRGCSALGYRSSRIARNSLGCDLTQCGNCVYGCRHGGKQTAAVTFLRDAQETGNLSLVGRCRADRLIVTNGRVSGVSATAVSAAGAAQHSVTVNARVVVVACGALHTPALLMRSGIELPELGRNLFIHPTTGVTGVFDQLIEAWKGPPQTVVCDEFAELRGSYGYRIETAVAHPGLLAAATPWLGAVHHRQTMQEVAHRALLIVLVRDRASGRVSIDADGRPRIRYRPRRLERQMLRHGMATAARILDAAGAKSISTVHVRPLGTERVANTDATIPQQIDQLCRSISTAPVGRNRMHLFSAHQMGTCRMGRDGRSAVCDANGEVFGVRGLFIGDASAFPLSSGVNPMITVMAMAHHTARRIADTW